VHVVFGIGNPGPEYDGTRHNVGFEVLEALRAGGEPQEWHAVPGLDARSCAVRRQGRQLLLVQPLTYVNRCGPVLETVLTRAGLPLDRLLVVVDDYQLPLGRLRLRGGGSDGGHNGLRSLVESLGSQAWPRLRVGIGHPEGRPPREYVLERFPAEERPTVDAAVARAAEAVALWARVGLARAMSDVNRADLDPPPTPA